MGNQGRAIWMYGLPSCGKTTIARELINKLDSYILLDGDDIRDLFDNDLGYSESDRNKQSLRLVKLCNLINRYGVDVILCTNSISENNRNIFRKGINNLIEVYVSCNLEECIKRDVKGLYKKAKKGLIKNFPGIDIPYEIPKIYDIKLETDKYTLDECIKILMVII